MFVLNPARYCSRNFWSSGVSLLKNVSLKLPSILTPQTVQDMAAICIGSPQHGQDVESILLFIIINISISTIKVNKNLGKILIFLNILVDLPHFLMLPHLFLLLAVVGGLFSQSTN
jgi:hypothetical protein